MASKKPENNVENKKGKKSFLIVAIPILAALLIAAIILFFVFKKDPDITTEKLMNISDCSLIQETWMKILKDLKINQLAITIRCSLIGGLVLILIIL